MNKSQLAILKRHAEVHGDTDLLWLVEQAEKAEVYKEALEEVEHLLNVAIEEINYSLNPYKDKDTKEVYLTNAIRFINTAIKNLNE